MTTSAGVASAGVEIRRLTVDDLDLFRDIRGEALRNYPETFGSHEEDQGGDAMIAAYRHWLGGTMLGAFECGALVGITGFYVLPYQRLRHRGHIYTVYVREAVRGKGVGDRLIKEILALAEVQVDQVHLAVVTTATPAIRTYERNGFEIYGTDPRVNRMGDVTFDNYLMVRRLR